MAIAYNPSISTDGLLLYIDPVNKKCYPGTGTSCTDLSTTANSITLANGVGYSSSNGGIFTFDGNNDHILVSSPSNRFDWTPSGNGLNFMSVEMFVNSTDTSGRYLSKPWNGNGEYNYILNASSLSLGIGNQSAGINFTSLATGTWQYVCFILTPTQAAIYRNGVISTDFTNHNITNNTPVSGAVNIQLCLMSLYPYGEGWAGNTGFSIQGSVGMLRVYNRILTAGEIYSNFNRFRGRFNI